ncbi:hypothetical protein CCY99_02840 [Helicobacter sp. 16-1353]|nr:hypothetical protein CCY99_02840 [Helicobacter sp. 16-1353]
MDGTLIDSASGIYESFEAVFKANNMKLPKREEISKYIGYTLQDMFAFLGVNRELVEQFSEEYKNYYVNICKQETKMLPNAINSIKLAYSFATLGIVTTKTSATSKKILAHFDVEKYFTTIIGREDVTQTKPDKEPILKAINNINKSGIYTENNNIFIIGDTILDLIAAQNAGINGIGVLCGFGEERHLREHSNVVVQDSLSAVKYIQTL